ncbi:MAG: helix-turn-helix domain-containing protein [Bifidobacteriaceae bacterium]|jgi:excisionase family DNA binding protein|nr:helix-turn-helix domain-containing protein [Bifidobacteriaceae bacterium]
MGRVTVRDSEALHRALEGGQDRVSVSLSRAAAEMLAKVVDAEVSGRRVVVSHGLDEVSPAEAGALLGMSRPQVRRLMDRGALPFRMVGSHHRIAVADVEEFLAAERPRRRAALERFSALEDELGLTE